jgi:hypothetical protein
MIVSLVMRLVAGISLPLAWIRFQATTSGIYGGQIGTGVRSPLSALVFPSQYNFTICHSPKFDHI